MKYGILFNKSNMNIGDDIQAYATGRFLPSVDYFIDREHIDEFSTETDEPVAVIMNAWYMWQKWNWPPSKYIYPLFVGFHYADHQLANQWYGSPIKYQFLSGKGGDYLNCYGPVGCRDMFTLNNLKEMGINAYFSGCITMTLPKMPETDDKGSYICLVDVAKKARDKIHEQYDGKIEIREMTHLRERDETLSWESRKKMVEELLTVYQNARCVVTKRLHCALPCLAMGVPVLLIRGGEDDTRFDPYYDFLYHSTDVEYAEGQCEYNLLNPPQNKDDFLSYRETLINAVTEFVNAVKDDKRTADEAAKTDYNAQDIINWRHDVMKNALEIWFNDDHMKHEKDVEKSRRISNLKSKLTEKNEAYRARGEKITALREKIQKRDEKLAAQKEKLEAVKAKSDAKSEKIAKLRQKNETLKARLTETNAQLEELKNESLWKTFKRKVKGKRN